MGEGFKFISYVLGYRTATKQNEDRLDECAQYVSHRAIFEARSKINPCTASYQVRLAG